MPLEFDNTGGRRDQPERIPLVGDVLRREVQRLGFYKQNISIANISAGGSSDATTYLRGDGNWAHIEAVRFPVKNTSGGTLAKGTPVYITGSVGASPTAEVAAAEASNAAKMPCVGLLEEELLNNDQGFATALGVLRGVNTSSYAINQVVFVGGGGGLTGTRPTAAGTLVQNIGRVLHVGANTGEILVMGPGRTNDVPNYTALSLLGRGAGGGDGAAQEITLGTNLSMSGTTLNATGGSGGGSITNGDYTAGAGFLLGRADAAPGQAAIQEINLGKGLEFVYPSPEIRVADLGIDTPELKSAAVTYAKIQNVSATDKLLGRSSAGAGVVEEITCTAAGRALLDDADNAAQRTTLGLATIASSASATDLTAGTVPTARLGSGTADATTFLRGDQTWATPGSSSPVKFADAPINAVNVASTTLVDLVSKTVTVTAGDTIEIELAGTITNNSGATRTYTFEAELGAFGVTCVDGTTVPAGTNRAPIKLRAVYAVKSTTESAVIIYAERAGTTPADTGVSIATTSYRHAWNTSASNFTGSQAIKLRCLSSAATATQTFTVFSYRITQHPKVI